MNEKLIAGYAAYTTADEYSAAATGDAPATTPLTTIAITVGSTASIASLGGVSALSVTAQC
ncbi:LxmA leader domain family RiPP [Streptomyces sp. NPDC048506]|uniref:LxmA leader domain family RiPP n=1 Tax=Streptomyces sp. NPDC048506 TaxID=3155028 RepID=UPI00343DF2A3